MIHKKIEIKAHGMEDVGNLYTYFLDSSIEMRPNEKRPVILMCPGGGYEMTSDREAEPMAMQFLAMGYHVAILRYSVSPVRYPVALQQVAESVLYLKEHADYILDSSQLLTRELKAELDKIFVKNLGFKNLMITVLSFGFKYGIPSDSDLVFDVRFLPNPYYIDELRPLSGNDKPVSDYVMNCEASRIFLDKLADMVSFLIPNYILEGKNQLVVSIGCTGGKHRSVTLANALYQRLEQSEEYGVRIEHRDIGKDAIRKKMNEVR